MNRRRNDLSLYERHAAGWWDPADRKFASLRSINRARLRWLLAIAGGHIADRVVADLGCGGGLLAVPLAAHGARVVGVDTSRASLAAAANRGAHGARFMQGDIRACPLASGCADLVLLADVVEHLPDWRLALAEAARVVRAGGLVYVNTLNRTCRARLLAVTLAEGLGLVPAGTHDPGLFVRPGELRAAAAAVGLRCIHLQGEAPALLRTLRRRAICLRASRSLAVAYTALFQRLGG